MDHSYRGEKARYAPIANAIALSNEASKLTSLLRAAPVVEIHGISIEDGENPSCEAAARSYQDAVSEFLTWEDAGNNPDRKSSAFKAALRTWLDNIMRIRCNWRSEEIVWGEDAMPNPRWEIELSGMFLRNSVCNCDAHDCARRNELLDLALSPVIARMHIRSPDGAPMCYLEKSKRALSNKEPCAEEYLSWCSAMNMALDEFIPTMANIGLVGYPGEE